MLLVTDVVMMDGNECAELSSILCASEDCPLITLIYRYFPLLYARHFLELRS